MSPVTSAVSSPYEVICPRQRMSCFNPQTTAVQTERCHTATWWTLTPGHFSTPRPLSVGVFLECHLPPNCNNIVEQRLFTNHQEDGTNFHHFLLSRLSVSLLRPFQFELLICSRQQAATSWFWQQLWILCSTQVVVSRGKMKFLWNHLFPKSLNYIFIIAAWAWQ